MLRWDLIFVGLSTVVSIGVVIVIGFNWDSFQTSYRTWARNFK